MSDLRRLYESRLQEQDPDFSGKVNATRLKERLLYLIPDLRAQTQGREVILMFNADIGEAIKIACSNNADDDAVHLVRAAQILRKEIFTKEYSFDGSFKPGCERDAVPESVLALVRMILRGPSIQCQKEASDANTKIALSLSQLLMFNVKKSTKEPSGSHTRHAKIRETPLVIYTGLMIHAKTRKRGLIDKLFSRGLCISYERIQEISTCLANSVCSQFERDGCVCPSRLKSDVFTVGAVDNIDHNLLGMLWTLSMGQPYLSSSFPHTEIQELTGNKYLSIQTLPINDLFAPVTEWSVKAESTVMSTSKEKEDGWLSVMAELILEKEKLDPKDFVSWSAYHANRESAVIRPVSPISLMPLFTEAAHTAAMIVHAMNVVAKAIQHLHPGQIPVITMDQPLFCIAKQIQWAWPDSFGEHKFVVIMGGLHIEMNVMKLLGDFLDGSGWTTILTQSDITTTGRAEAVLKGSHVTRSRYVHQVTAAALYLLQLSAFQTYTGSLAPDDAHMDFKTW